MAFLRENGFDRPENPYGRCGVASFFVQRFHVYRRGGWSRILPLKNFVSGLWAVLVDSCCRGRTWTVFGLSIKTEVCSRKKAFSVGRTWSV